MLKIVLCAYARGIFSSREIAAECQENVVMMALSANSRPHFTTIAQFVRELGPTMMDLFTGVLLYCDELNLIGKDMFAIDGCKFSSNASKEWSGTRAEFETKRHKFRVAVEKLVAEHRMMDKNGLPESIPGKRAKKEKNIYRKAKVCADSGFHTEASMKMLSEKKIDGYVPDKLRPNTH